MNHLVRWRLKMAPMISLLMFVSVMSYAAFIIS